MPDTRTTLDYIDEQLRAHAAAWREAQLEGRTDQADFYEQRVNRMLETRWDMAKPSSSTD